MKKYAANILFFIALLSAWNAKGQIIGDWFFSHSYLYSLELDMSQKRLELPTVFVVSTDSIVSYRFEEDELKKSSDIYFLKDDSIKPGSDSRKNFGLQYILQGDTLCLIDNCVKGFYGVFRKIEKSKKSTNITDLKNTFATKVFVVDFTKFPIDYSEYPNIQIDNCIVRFSSDNVMFSNSIQSGAWRLISINGNTYLLINQFLFQIEKINKKYIYLNSYYFNPKRTIKWKILKI